MMSASSIEEADVDRKKKCGKLYIIHTNIISINQIYSHSLLL